MDRTLFKGLGIVCNTSELLIMCYCGFISYVTRLHIMIDCAGYND